MWSDICHCAGRVSGSLWAGLAVFAVFAALADLTVGRSKKSGHHESSAPQSVAHTSATRVTWPTQVQTRLRFVVLQAPACGAEPSTSGEASATSRTLLGLGGKAPRGIERTGFFAVLATGLVPVAALGLGGRFIARARCHTAAGDSRRAGFRSVRPAPHSIGDSLYSKASAAHELRHQCVLPLKTQCALLSEHTILA